MPAKKSEIAPGWTIDYADHQDRDAIVLKPLSGGQGWSPKFCVQ